MTQQPGCAPVDDRTVRTAYGVPRDVERIQALVPDEPVEATVQVVRAWERIALLAGIALAFAWVVHADQQNPPSGRWDPTVVAVMVVAWSTPLLLSGLVRDRVSPLRLGAWQRGAVAVTPTRVLVVRRSFWTGRPVAVSRELDRATLPASLERRPWRFTTLRLRMPDDRTVLLRLPRGRDIAQRIPAPLVIGPAGTRWSVDPDDPMRARLWSDGAWTATSDHLVNVQTAQVVVATA
jgi:hypothetical protein